jgi:hypothetical protein
MKTCLIVRLHAHQFFLLTTALFFVFAVSSIANLVTGQIYTLKFVDLDGRILLTADGHVTVIVLTTRADVAKAQMIGARVPDYCLGNPTYRMVTVLNFGKKYGGGSRSIVTLLMRHRLDVEAAQLQRRYDARGVGHDARRDLFAVADFDGTATAQLGLQPESAVFRVFVFGRNGKLLRQWQDVPSAPELASVVK